MSINLVSIFRCSSFPSNPVYVRRVDLSVLSFSLSSHRHSYISLLFISRFITYTGHRWFFGEMTWDRTLNVWRIHKFILLSNLASGTQGQPVCCFFVFLGNLSRSSSKWGKRCTRVKLVLCYFSLCTELLMSISRLTEWENLQKSSNPERGNATRSTTGCRCDTADYRKTRI